jgi:hypothetical protein
MQNAMSPATPQRNLPHIGEAARLAGLLAGRGEDWEEERGQDRHDGDHGQELD